LLSGLILPQQISPAIEMGFYFLHVIQLGYLNKVFAPEVFDSVTNQLTECNPIVKLSLIPCP